jgi:hypothetical protein
MDRQEAKPPTLEQFLAQSHESLAFLVEFGFHSTSLPQQGHVNLFQVRYSSATLTFVIRGEGWGQIAAARFEDSSVKSVPLVLFIPPEQRRPPIASNVGDSPQLTQVRGLADQVREHCLDLLHGDLERFYSRAAEWERMSKSPSKSY